MLLAAWSARSSRATHLATRLTASGRLDTARTAFNRAIGSSCTIFWLSPPSPVSRILFSSATTASGELEPTGRIATDLLRSQSTSSMSAASMAARRSLADPCTSTRFMALSTRTDPPFEPRLSSMRAMVGAATYLAAMMVVPKPSPAAWTATELTPPVSAAGTMR